MPVWDSEYNEIEFRWIPNVWIATLLLMLMNTIGKYGLEIITTLKMTDAMQSELEAMR